MATDKPGWTRRPIVKTPEASYPDPTPLDPASAYVEQLGPGSRRTMREALDKLADWASQGRCGSQDLPWHLLRLEHTAALRTRLCGAVAPATANKTMAALRGVLKQCARQGLISDEDYRRITDLPPIRGVSPRRSNSLAPADYERIARACAVDTSPSGARDAALLALLRSSSLRRAEAVALDLADYDLRQGTLRLRSTNRAEAGPLVVAASARRALELWIQIRGREAGPLFNPVNKGGRIERRRLSEQAIYIACQKRASEAGLPPTSPEDLRRAHAAV